MNEGMENLKEIQDLEERSINPLIRIANTLEEILRLVTVSYTHLTLPTIHLV